MQVQAVLFDLFDTLLLIDGDESFYLPSLRKLYESLAQNGLKVSFEDFEHVYFEARDEVYKESAEQLEEPHFNVRVARTLQKLGYAFAVSSETVTGATKAFAEEFTRFIRIDDAATEVLEKLHKKYKLGLVSNFAIPECVRSLLQMFNLDRFFRTIVISGEINKRKPSPEIFHVALKALEVDPARALFVGDTPSMDVKGSKKVGIKAVLISRKTSTADQRNLVYQPEQDQENVEPDIVIQNLSELLTILENS